MNHDGLHEPDAVAPRQATSLARTQPLSRALWLVPLTAAAAIGWGVYQHEQRDRLAATTQQEVLQFVPRVRVAEAKRLAGPLELALPGTTEPAEQATIRARATGYIGERRVDIGSRVKAGDLLARIDAPDLDQQIAQGQAQLLQTAAALAQARARLVQSKADLELAGLNNTRTAQLARTGYSAVSAYDATRLGLASKQGDLRNAEAGIDVAEANVAAQSATLDRLRQLASFRLVVAPFDGVVTSRGIDTGDLVNADSAGNALFTVVRDNVLRVRIQVPQSDATAIRPGLPAEVTVPELPGRRFEGRVARSAVALTAASRSLTTEVDVPNADGALRPGLYVSVRLKLPRDVPAVVVPADALLFDADGVAVLTVQEGDTVKRKAVSVRRDFGREVELSEGLAGGERVVLGPSAGFPDGGRVAPVAPPKR